jgi:hypothetical protein
MADTPIFPDDENLDNAREYRSIQKDINEFMKTQYEFLKQKSSLTRSVQQQLESQNIKDTAHLADIQKNTERLYELIQERVKVEATEAKDLERTIKSVQTELKWQRELIGLSQDRAAAAIEADKRAQAESKKWVNIVKSGLKEITGLEIKEFSTAKKFGLEMEKVAGVSRGVGLTFGAIVMMLKGSVDLFKHMDKAAWEFREAMGMTRSDSQMIRKDAERLAIDYMSMGITIEGVYKSYQAIGQVVGGIHNVTKDMARDVSLMAFQLGISEEVSAGFMRNLAAVSKSTMESQQNMMGLAQSMSGASGVPLNQIMSDVSKASGTTLTMMSRLPNVALRSSIELRRMGTSLGDAAKSSRHMLDFTENINEEMEASVLLGRSINLQRARELAYRRDLEGSTKEILRISKSISFEKLDPFQQEAFARATGKSVDELLKMVQTDRQLQQIKRSGTPQQKAELAMYEKMRRENEASAKARAKDAMVQLRTVTNQERLAQIQNKWNQLMAQMQRVFLPAIDKILGFIVNHFDAIKWISIAIGTAWLTNKLLMWDANLAGIAMGKNLGNVLFKLKPVSGLFVRFAGSAWSIVRAIGMVVGLAGGAAWSGLLSVGASIMGIIGSIGSFIMSIPALAVAAAFAIGYGIGTLLNKFKFVQNAATKLWLFIFKMGDVISTTFSRAWNGLKKWFGHSPSELGRLIWMGIKAVGGSIYNALISPFAKSWGFIKSLFGLKSPHKLETSVENKARAAYVPAVTITPNGTQIETPAAKAAAQKKQESDASLGMTEETGKKMVALLEKILAKDTSIKMDGQLLGTSLARQTEFKGGYGVNKV